MNANYSPTTSQAITSLNDFSDLMIALPIKQGYELVSENSILYCKAEGNYTQFFFFSGRKMLISRKLKEVVSNMATAYFLRIHQSYYVNMRYARQYIRRSGGQLVIEGGVTLPISKTYKEKVLNLFRII